MSADSAIQQEIVIITGLSGAGRSTAAKSLEDLDWFVADNLPVDLLFASPQKISAVILAAVAELSESERTLVLTRNAERTYRI